MSSDQNKVQNKVQLDKVSIPLEQGSVFRQNKKHHKRLLKICLNPFGTGQCLPTTKINGTLDISKVSIPLEQGSVFRPFIAEFIMSSCKCLNPFGTGQCLPTVKALTCFHLKKSQSLWNRAVSSDLVSLWMYKIYTLSQSLWNRAVSSDFTSGSLFSCFFLMSQSLWNRAVSSDC